MSGHPKFGVYAYVYDSTVNGSAFLVPIQESMESIINPSFLLGLKESWTEMLARASRNGSDYRILSLFVASDMANNWDAGMAVCPMSMEDLKVSLQFYARYWQILGYDGVDVNWREIKTPAEITHIQIGHALKLLIEHQLVNGVYSVKSIIGVFVHVHGNYVDYNGSLEPLYEQEIEAVIDEDYVHSIIRKNWNAVKKKAQDDRDRVADAWNRGVVDPGFGYGIMDLFVAASTDTKLKEYIAAQPFSADSLDTDLRNYTESFEILKYLTFEESLNNPDEIEDITVNQMIASLKKVRDSAVKHVSGVCASDTQVNGTGLNMLLSAANAGSTGGSPKLNIGNTIERAYVWCQAAGHSIDNTYVDDRPHLLHAANMLYETIHMASVAILDCEQVQYNINGDLSSLFVQLKTAIDVDQHYSAIAEHIAEINSWQDDAVMYGNLLLPHVQVMKEIHRCAYDLCGFAKRIYEGEH